MPKGIALIIAKKAMGDEKAENEYAEMAADLIRYVKDEDKEGLADLLEALATKAGGKTDEEDDEG